MSDECAHSDQEIKHSGCDKERRAQARAQRSDHLDRIAQHNELRGAEANVVRGASEAGQIGQRKSAVVDRLTKFLELAGDTYLLYQAALPEDLYFSRLAATSAENRRICERPSNSEAEG